MLKHIPTPALGTSLEVALNPHDYRSVSHIMHLEVGNNDMAVTFYHQPIGIDPVHDALISACNKQKHQAESFRFRLTIPPNTNMCETKGEVWTVEAAALRSSVRFVPDEVITTRITLRLSSPIAIMAASDQPLTMRESWTRFTDKHNALAAR